jgi:hypothetical protein
VQLVATDGHALPVGHGAPARVQGRGVHAVDEEKLLVPAARVADLQAFASRSPCRRSVFWPSPAFTAAT